MRQHRIDAVHRTKELHQVHENSVNFNFGLTPSAAAVYRFCRIMEISLLPPDMTKA